jgi:cell division protease FtsH
LAATNRPEILDPALLRAGRFDRQVLVDRPDKKGRIQILNVHMKKVKTAPDVDADKVAALTPGFTGADLANLVNEAALLATRRREREIVAYHEMGHALVALALPGVGPVHKIFHHTPRSRRAGLHPPVPNGRPLFDDAGRTAAQDGGVALAVLLGGRAAELIVFDHLSTGAADDLRRVTDIARSMVTRYGMSLKLGNVAYDREPAGFSPGLAQAYRDRDFAEQTAASIDEEVRTIVQETFERTLNILRERRALLEQGERRLLEKETLEETEIAELWSAAPNPHREAAE